MENPIEVITESGEQTTFFISDAHYEGGTDLTIKYIDRELSVRLDQEQLKAFIAQLQTRVQK